MPRKIIWLPSAARDVARLRDFIKSKNPRAAQRAAQRIIEGTKLLQDNPGAGAPVENLLEYRELVLAFGSGDYVIRYREEAAQVFIVRLRHSKEKPL